MSKAEMKCKTSDQKTANLKATDSKVVILIDSEGKHQIKQRQKPTISIQPLERSRYAVHPSTAILPDGFGRMTLHVPCVGQEEIFYL